MSLLPYEIGTCLFCRKCMFCGKNRTTEVKFYRNCSYILDNNDLYAQKVQESVIKYNYNIFLNKTFNYTLCSSCNGKTYREKRKSGEQELSTGDSMPSST